MQLEFERLQLAQRTFRTDRQPFLDALNVEAVVARQTAHILHLAVAIEFQHANSASHVMSLEDHHLFLSALLLNRGRLKGHDFGDVIDLVNIAHDLASIYDFVEVHPLAVRVVFLQESGFLFLDPGDNQMLEILLKKFYFVDRPVACKRNHSLVFELRGRRDFRVVLVDLGNENVFKVLVLQPQLCYVCFDVWP